MTCCDCKHFELLAYGICRNPECEWFNQYVDWNDKCDGLEPKVDDET